MTQELRLRPMERADWAEVADLIYVSTNYWYRASGKPAIFSGGPTATELFCKVYEDLDPGCCVVAESPRTRRLMGSCFFHPRETHVSLGIMNVHPNYFGAGVARRLLRHITDYADAQGRKPVRLVSSAMNLDSFSLYTRAGFVPRQAYQDVLLSVPPDGLPTGGLGAALASRVRPARVEDVEAIAALELDVRGISRRKDYRYFIQNDDRIWHISVLEGDRGRLDGFLASINHPGSNMVGPGVARTQEGAAALLHAELNEHRGRSPVFLVPVDSPDLVRQVYAWGGRNVELHFAQVRGDAQPFSGISLPTFMPETG